MIYYVYIHIREDNGQPFYVGKGTYDSIKKEYSRANSKTGRNLIWKRTVEKYGFIVKIIFESEKESEAFLKEIELIKLYGRRDLKSGILCNLTEGGEGASGKIISEETKRKLSIAHQGKKKPWSTICHKGKKLSEEHVKKLSLANRNRVWNSEWHQSKNKKCYRYALTGKYIDEFICIKNAAKTLNVDKVSISKCISGKINIVEGYQWKDYKTEYINPVSYKKRMPVILNKKHTLSVMQFSKDENLVKEWDSIEEASLNLKIDGSSISRVCKQRPKYKTAGGFIWKYKDDLCNKN